MSYFRRPWGNKRKCAKEIKRGANACRTLEPCKLWYVIARFIGESRRRASRTCAGNHLAYPRTFPPTGCRRSLFDLVSHVDRKLARPGDLVATSWAISHPCRASPSSTARTEVEVTSSSLWSTIRCTCLRSTSKSKQVTMPRSREGESREER